MLQGNVVLQEFDTAGLLFAITEIAREQALPLPDGVCEKGLCQLCLGSNVPDQKRGYPEGGFRCGSWCDGHLPIFRICERFQVDRQKVAELAERIRPSEDTTGGVVVRSSQGQSG